MSVGGSEQVERDTLNVVSLFGEADLNHEALSSDPLTDLIEESLIEDKESELIEVRSRNVVTESQFPDQSMHILDQQLKSLRSNMNRIRFYLDDVEDLLPG
jgi:hypothetical protein